MHPRVRQTGANATLELGQDTNTPEIRPTGVNAIEKCENVDKTLGVVSVCLAPAYHV